MVAEHKIDRQKLISGHNPVLTEIATDSPLTVAHVASISMKMFTPPA